MIFDGKVAVCVMRRWWKEAWEARVVYGNYVDYMHSHVHTACWHCVA
jgi:hypothetical protein